MKSSVLRQQLFHFNHYIPYPNASTRRQVLHKILDLMLIAASGVGIAAMVALMLVL